MLERIKNSRTARGEEGFTLIELLVVIIILGILAAVVVFAVGGVGDKGQEASCTIDERTIRTAEEAFLANDKTPPAGYGSEVELVPAYLSEASEYHDITVVDPVDANSDGDTNDAGDTAPDFTLTRVGKCA